MANWLQKVLPPAKKLQGRGNLPVRTRPSGPLSNLQMKPDVPDQLPNASIIYGAAAAALFVIALYFMLFGHRIFAGFMVMLLACAFLGFALHFLKYNKY